MSKLTPTPELIANILARIPEGFVHHMVLAGRIKIERNTSELFTSGTVAYDGDYWYDSSRLALDELRERATWSRPALPDMTANGYFLVRPINEQVAARAELLASDSAALDILQTLAATPGFAPVATFDTTEETRAALEKLLAAGMLRQLDNFIFDHLRLSAASVEKATRKTHSNNLRDQLIDYLEAQPGSTASLPDLREKFGKEFMREIMGGAGFVGFGMPLSNGSSITWLRPKDSDRKAAEAAALETMQRIAAEARAREDERWAMSFQLSGETQRPDAREGKTSRMQVIARTYTLVGAAKRLGLHEDTLEAAIHDDLLPSFVDPEGTRRIPASEVEAAAADSQYLERISAYETITSREISIVSSVSYSTVRRRLQRGGVTRTNPLWGQVRGKWNLPETLREFQEIRRQKLAERKAEREAARLEIERQLQLQREQEREAREALRLRLVAAFPTWRHEGRIDQRIHLHIGPPNSGKTHDALIALAEAERGWYLAPLRLLAYEIFDRLNQRGVRCNLLTGEEYIPVPGATITAATVEMFNPIESGKCVIIDEAQMLADPDRGWAWTRALMEAEAPDIHVIGPHTAQALIEKLAGAAAIPVTVIPHERLAPIQVAEKPWTVKDLPPRTILVAFSRQMVLQLKTELEKYKRTVSIVYGNLPPEVRRRQADRFAEGETEICIATDAVGMGLNLPADYVCFYEVEKFDGRQTRMLLPGEVQQIGGRAGRYGLSKAGEIGAVDRADLEDLRLLYYTPPVDLTHARVAPTVVDLEMLPGNLATKLAQWASLQSIPDALRGVIQTADMTERIELARMLTNEQVDQLGLSAALRLVNAPTRQSTRGYWLLCAHAIIAGEPMPMPPAPPVKIMTSVDLENIETCVSSADIYLWLANRREFGMYGPEEPEVRIRRTQWSMRIDTALLNRLDMARRCSRCGAPLPLRYPYGMCNNCFNRRSTAVESSRPPGRRRRGGVRRRG